MKKTKLVFLLLLAGLCLASCKGKQKETKSVEPQTKKTAVSDLTDLEIAAQPSQFAAVTENQSWSFETDMNQNSVPAQGIAETEEVTYFNCANILIAFPKGEAFARILCDKADCTHDSFFSDTECEASLSHQGLFANGLQYYEGSLYYTVKQGGIALYRVSSDGKKKMQTALISESSTGSQQNFPWLIHRGYIYFWNEGKGIYKVSMLNPEQRELIIKEPDNQDSLYHQLKAYGSYLYFTLAGMGEEDSFFCRYNTESGQIEYFSEINETLNDFYVKDNKIYYQINNDARIYQYDTVSGQQEVYFELGSGRYSFYADEDYIYLPKENSGNNSESFYDVSADVYTWEKEFVGTVPLQRRISEGTQTYAHDDFFHITGSDSDRIYYETKFVDGEFPAKEIKTLSYINKSEISENGTDMKTALEGSPFLNYI